jgi:hypothetical protein
MTELSDISCENEGGECRFELGDVDDEGENAKSRK